MLDVADSQMAGYCVTRWRAVAAAGLIMAGTVTFPAAAQALPAVPAVKIGPIPIPIPGLPPISLPSVCAVHRGDPPVRTPAQGLSGVFDGTPAVTPGTGASIYDDYSSHPFAWFQYDPGCLGPAGDPPVMLDTWLGNEELGLAQDTTAFAAGMHRLVTNPTWLHVADGLEQQTTTTLKSHIWDVFLPLSLLLIGVLIIVRSRRGAMADALKVVAWTVLVMGAVTVVASEPTRAGSVADRVETSAVNAVPAALTGQQNATADAFGNEELQQVLYPLWLRGELGAATGPAVDAFGVRLLGDTAMTWAEVAADENGVNTKLKQKAFEADAAAISTQFPSSYSVLKGSAEGRFGLGFEAMFGVAMTVPFQVIADLLVVASLLIIRLAVVLLPLLAVLGIHYQFRGVLLKVLSMVGAALINAVLFASAAAVNVYLVGFLLTAATIPTWFALVLAGVCALLMWLVLKPVRRLTTMMNASDVNRALTSSVRDLRHTVERGTKVGVAAATGGTSAAAVAAAGTMGRPPVRESIGDRPREREPVTA